jgi:hypothetical protein
MSCLSGASVEVVLALALTRTHGCAGQMEQLQRQLEAAKSEAERVKAAAERAKRDVDEKTSRDFEVMLIPFTITAVTHSKSEPAGAHNCHSTSAP